MSDLVEFLRARLDEDEHDARDLIGTPDRHQYGPVVTRFEPGDESRLMFGGSNLLITAGRVLAEVEAKRSMIEAAGDYVSEFEAEEWRTNDQYSAGRCRGRARSWRQETLQALALPYADHPDYNEAWRPTPRRAASR